MPSDADSTTSALEGESHMEPESIIKAAAEVIVGSTIVIIIALATPAPLPPSPARAGLGIGERIFLGVAVASAFGTLALVAGLAVSLCGAL
jgi:hypothetical protein